MATGNVMFFQWFGGAILTCVAKTIFTSSIGPALAVAAPGVDPATIIHNGATGLRNMIPPNEWHGVLIAYNEAIDHVFVSQNPVRLLRYSKVAEWAECCWLLVLTSIYLGPSTCSSLLCFRHWVRYGLEESEEGAAMMYNRQ